MLLRIGRIVIHGVRAVAELKPSDVKMLGVDESGHPRRQSRGRIEAKPSQTVLSRDSSVIHGVRAVAVLKLSDLLYRKGINLVIHGVRAVAELKHEVRRFVEQAQPLE